MNHVPENAERAGGDLDELAAFAEDEVLVLDDELCVRAFSRGCVRRLRLSAAHVGAPLASVPGALQEEQLAGDVRAVLELGGERRRDVGGREAPRTARTAVRAAFDGAPRVVVSWRAAVDRDTACARLEHELDECTDEVRAIVDTAVDAIVTIDGRGTIDVFNRAAERLFGYARHEVRGRNVTILMPEDAAAELDRYPRRYLETRAPHVAGIGREVVGRRKDGSTFPAELRLVHYDDERFAGFVRDLSERKALEAERIVAQKLDVIGRLAAGVSHDFKNLLTGIAGGLRMIRDRIEVSGEVERMFEDVRVEVERGAALSRKLLDLGRSDEGEPSLVRPAELLARAERTYRGAIGEDVTVVVACPDPTLAVRVAPDRLEHAVLDLVVNARDALPRGGTIVLACRAEHAGSDSRVAVEVRDDGVGMDAATLARASEAFFTTKEVGRGTGLGLASVRRFVDEHGGELAIESRVGAGTCVRLLLPRVDATLGEAPDAAVHPTVGGGDGRLVLVVEDQRLVGRVIAHALEAAGYAVEVARAPIEALERLDRDGLRPDLLLTDVVLPGMDGIELAAEVRSKRPGLPVLLMSAFPARELVARGRVPSGTVTLEKPFEDAELCAKVRAALVGDTGRA